MNFISKYAYYVRFSKDMKIRKELDRENRKMKKKLRNIALPFQLRWQERLINNKKKTIFFVLLFGVFNYYYGPEYLYHKFINIEPLNLKLRRWIFGEKNQPYITLYEQHPDSLMDKEVIEQLKQFYLQSESEYQFGISRKLLYTIYDKLELFSKPEERLGFYRQSGYYKKRNQKICSVHFAQFIKIFEDALKKLKKKDKSFTETQLLEQFKTMADEIKPSIIEWEIKIQQKRKEFSKLVPELQEHKDKIIRRVLSHNLYATEQEIEEQVQKNGLDGLSLREKLIIVDIQLSFQRILLDNKMNKFNRYNIFGQQDISSNKEKKLKQSIDLLTKQVQELQMKKQEICDQFKILFKKQQLFEI